MHQAQACTHCIITQRESCKHVCVQTRTHKHTTTHMHPLPAASTNMTTRAHTDICEHAYTHIYIYTHIHVHADVHTYICTYIHTYLHTYAHTLTPTQTCINTYMHAYVHNVHASVQAWYCSTASAHAWNCLLTCRQSYFHNLGTIILQQSGSRKLAPHHIIPHDSLLQYTRAL